MLAFGDFHAPVVDQNFFTPTVIRAQYTQRPLLAAEQILAAASISKTSRLSNTQLYSDVLLSGSGGTLNSFTDTLAFKAEQLKQVDAIASISRLWENYLLDPQSSVDVDVISESIDHVYEAIERFGPGAVDLTKITKNAVNGEHLAAILRVSSPWKNQVPGWSAALDIAAQALTLAGIEADEALAGL